MAEEINHDRRRFLGPAAMTIAAAEFVMIGSVDAQFSKRIILPISDVALGDSFSSSGPRTPSPPKGGDEGRP